MSGQFNHSWSIFAKGRDPAGLHDIYKLMLEPIILLVRSTCSSTALSGGPSKQKGTCHIPATQTIQGALLPSSWNRMYSPLNRKISLAFLQLKLRISLCQPPWGHCHQQSSRYHNPRALVLYLVVYQITQGCLSERIGMEPHPHPSRSNP